jgi:hypothetical protein
MAVDLSKLSFYSGSRYERIALKGNLPFSIASFAFPTFTITHNLGYIPYVKLWYVFSDSAYFQMFSGASSFSIDGNLIQVDDITVTTTTISVTMENDDSVTHTGTIYYRIYAEPQA